MLNIQITNASLPDIQGAIGAGIDDGGWISTAYLVAEIVVIPLTGFLTPVFSLRRYLLANTVLFLVMSVACAFAANLQQMIVLRALQGFFGGVLIPLAFTITLTMLPRSKQPIGLAMFALSATFAPAIGPTIGGYLTETYGWQYIFYVNLVPGAIMLATLLPSLPRAPMQLGLLRRRRLARHRDAGDRPCLAADRAGGRQQGRLVRLAVHRAAVVVAVVALALFIWIELTTAQPLLNLRLLRRRNFGLGSVGNVILGMALYGSVYLLPNYLSQMQGYNAQQIGEVLAWTGLPQLRADPVRAAADAAVRCAPAGRRRPWAVRGELLPEHRDQPGLQRPAAAGAEPGARRRPGAGADAAVGRSRPAASSASRPARPPRCST